MRRKFTRREFLKLSSISFTGLAVAPRLPLKPLPPENGPGSVERYGRVTGSALQRMTRPGAHGKRVDYVYKDDVFPIYQEVIGDGWFPHNHLWYEIPGGYVYSSWVQPVENIENVPLAASPKFGQFGEISVPYADARTEPDPEAPSSYRVYYSATFNIDEIVTAADGSLWYHIDDENGKILWIPAESFRPIQPEEISPISPDVDDKSIEVDLTYQTLSAFENGAEVFRTTISSGTSFFGSADEGLPRLTPLGSRPIWSKRISRHMEGGTLEQGWDLPGVGWVSYFTSNGAAIHSTYWHNDYGRPRSAGCLNCRPEAARWIFRWTMPVVDYVPGNITVKWPGGTRINISETV